MLMFRRADVLEPYSESKVIAVAEGWDYKFDFSVNIIEERIKERLGSYVDGHCAFAVASALYNEYMSIKEHEDQGSKYVDKWYVQS